MSKQSISRQKELCRKRKLWHIVMAFGIIMTLGVPTYPLIILNLFYYTIAVGLIISSGIKLNEIPYIELHQTRVINTKETGHGNSRATCEA